METIVQETKSQLNEIKVNTLLRPQNQGYEGQAPWRKPSHSGLEKSDF